MFHTRNHIWGRSLRETGLYDGTMHPRHPNRVPMDWDSDRVDRANETQVDEAYFDEALSAWVLSRYADVVAAFRSSSLMPVGPRTEAEPSKENDIEMAKMRSETRSALSPLVLEQWQSNFESAAGAILDGLADSNPFDLVHEYARPLCNHVAVTVTGISLTDARNFIATAEEISAAAAEPLDPQLASRAKAAAIELQPHFSAGPVTLRESGFVALSLTLCRMLSNAWLALIQHPDEWARLHSDPALTPLVIEELMRFAGLPRMLFRMATQDVNLNGTQMRQGDRVILRLIAANRDPAQFNDPGTLVISKHSTKHLCLGTGVHACAGAPLLRMSMAVATRNLVERYKSVELCGPVEWQGGSGFLFPSGLQVLAHNNSQSKPARL